MSVKNPGRGRFLRFHTGLEGMVYINSSDHLLVTYLADVGDLWGYVMHGYAQWCIFLQRVSRKVIDQHPQSGSTKETLVGAT
jgi:hypothetical protein